MSRTPRRLVDRRGQSLVEFALVVPLLLLMLAGIIEFGRAWNWSQVVSEAARAGARKAAVLNAQVPAVSSSDITDSVDNVVAASLLSGAHIICSTCVTKPIDGAGTGEAVTVEVKVPYNFVIFGPVMALAQQSFSDSTITLRSAAIMRNE
ncbi:MAG TPA: TadE/TadG family type IV pilus assembly protein [Gemmatimonadales bacterium]|jgi:Flp pilus assembly protein TadG